MAASGASGTPPTSAGWVAAAMMRMISSPPKISLIGPVSEEYRCGPEHLLPVPRELVGELPRLVLLLAVGADQLDRPDLLADHRRDGRPVRGPAARVAP